MDGPNATGSLGRRNARKISNFRSTKQKKYKTGKTYVSMESPRSSRFNQLWILAVQQVLFEIKSSKKYTSKKISSQRSFAWKLCKGFCGFSTSSRSCNLPKEPWMAAKKQISLEKDVSKKKQKNFRIFISKSEDFAWEVYIETFPQTFPFRSV